MAMARTTAPSSDVPLLKLLYKRLRLLRKKHTRITQTEERLAQGKALNSDQEEILRSKPVVTALVEELENLRSAALPGDLLSSTPGAQDVVTAPSSDVPVLKLLYKRLGLLRKKRTRVIQMEERVAQGKALHREQEEILNSKPVVTALIEELENLHSAAVSEEFSLSTPVTSTEAQEKPLLDVVASPSSDVPVLKLLSKRLGLLRKKRTRIIQIEERVAQGKALNSDQEEILNSKPVVTALIEELESLRSAALPEDRSSSTPVASTEAREKPSQDVVAAAAVEDSTVMLDPVLEPVSETPVQVDAATTDSLPKEVGDLNTLEGITTASQELEAVAQRQNLKDTKEKEWHEVPHRNLRNTKYTNSWIDGRRDDRGGRGGYHFGRGQYYDNTNYNKNFEYQNNGGQYYGNGHNQRDFDSHNGKEQYYDPGYYPREGYQNGQGYPRYYQNGGGQYNDSGYYSRNTYSTRGRGAGRGGGYANNLDNNDAATQSAPNKDVVSAQRAPNNHVGLNQGSNNGVAEGRRPNRGPNHGVASQKSPILGPNNSVAEQRRHNRGPNNDVAAQKSPIQGPNNSIVEQRRPNRGPNNGVAVQKGPNHGPNNASVEQV